jgi:hypothetical protein
MMHFCNDPKPIELGLRQINPNEAALVKMGVE